MKKRKCGKAWRLPVLAVFFLTILLSGTVLKTQAATPKLNKKKLVLMQGEKFALKVSGTRKKITWKSSDASVARVTSKGNVTAKKVGTVKITAKIKGGKTLTCTVKVIEKPVVYAGLVEVGERPYPIVAMYITVRRPRYITVIDEITLKTAGQASQTLSMYDLDYAAAKGEILWFNSYKIPVYKPQKENAVFLYYAKRDGSSFLVNGTSKATMYFKYCGIKMKAVVPYVNMENGEGVSVCKVTRVK